MKNKIQKGDKVIVLKGSAKGTIGSVLSVINETRRVLVKGVNFKTKHIKPRQKGEKGEMVRKEFPIDISNVAFYDDKEKAGSRISFSGEGRDKTRISKKSGKKIEMTKSNK